MIEITVREAALKRGIKTAYQLAQRMGDKKSKMTAGRLWEGKWPERETLDRVAEALGDCDLTELIRRVPDKKAKGSPARRGEARKRTKSK